MKDLKFICEEWRDVPNFEGYQVSSLGKIRGIDRLKQGRSGLRLTRGQELKQVPNKKGYPEVRLRKNGTHTRLVHKLVSSAFLVKSEGCTQINHINGVKTDNSVINLEWVTQSENQKHAYKLGLQPSRAGESNNKATITDKDVTKLKLLYNLGRTTKEVSELIGVNLSIIRQIIYGQSWRSNTTPILKRDDRLKPTTI
jgi:hypothetical protein